MSRVAFTDSRIHTLEFWADPARVFRGQFITNNPANTSPTLVVQALGAQPGNLQEWVDTSANRLMVVTSAGFVGIGTANPKAAFDVANTGTIASAIIVPRDSTANRPTVAVNGMIRYNSATSKFEAYENAVWTNMIGGGSGSFPLLANPIGTAAAPAYSFSGNANTGSVQSRGESVVVGLQWNRGTDDFRQR